MSDRRLISTNPEMGTTSWFYYDDAEDKFTVEEVQDAAPIIEMNKTMTNLASDNWRGDWHLVASIPLTVLEILRKQGILDDPKRMKKWLNDPDNRYFRTRGGRV